MAMILQIVWSLLIFCPQSTKAKAKAVSLPPAPLDDEVDEDEDYDPLAGFTAAQKRRVMAMKETQAKYDLLNQDYQKELATLQAKFQQTYGAHP